MKKISIIMLVFMFAVFLLPLKARAALGVASCVLLGNGNSYVACDSYEYSDWSTCNINGVKTRQIVKGLPAGCSQCATDSVKPILSVSCTPSCESRVYSDWGACVNGKQTRTVLQMSPLGCEGEPGDNLVLEQGCIACTSRIYSNWSDCVDGDQQRMMLYKLPQDCVGEPATPSKTRQTCGENVTNTETVVKEEKKSEAPKVEVKSQVVAPVTQKINVAPVVQNTIKTLVVTSTLETTSTEITVDSANTAKNAEENKIITDVQKPQVEEVVQKHGFKQVMSNIFSGVKSFFSKLKFW